VTEVHAPIAGGGDNCPQCGSALAKDQRYCLVCGARRGDPRLPFMDAVVFMDAVKHPHPGDEGEGAKPAPAPSKRPLLSANASLVAGVATLVLAIGVGVLIGRTGDSGGSEAAASPQIIRVGGGGGGEVEEESGGSAESGKKKGKNSSSGGKSDTAVKKKAKEKTKTEANGASKALNEVYESDVPIEEEIQPGESCEKEAAGCGKNGKFDGSFFGE
jgi:hypothetical protein